MMTHPFWAARARRPHPVRRPSRPLVESLEERFVLSWLGVPPSAISPPTANVAVTLNSQGDASGNASITANEVDYYSFVAPASGAYRINALTPSSRLDTVLGVFSATGGRLAYNDDISSTNRDSQLTVTLTAGNRYYFGVTNYTGTRGGSYTWGVDGPAAGSPSPAPPGTPAPGAFDIVIRSSGLTSTQQQAFDQAAARWEQVIVGDVPDATYQGTAVDDILIDASSVPIDGVNGILGQAGPDYIRGGSALPIHGIIQFDTADLASLESNNMLLDVILHEMGHVLGIGTIWQTRGLLAGAGTANPQFTGARATAEYNALFGTSATGVPVEGKPAPQGTRDGHWRESVFGNELMTGYISGPSNPISRITVASLADLGYTVNMAAADAYTPPRTSAVRGSDTMGGSGTTLVWAGPAGSDAARVGDTSLVWAEPTDWITPPIRRPPFTRPAAARTQGAVA